MSGKIMSTINTIINIGTKTRTDLAIHFDLVNCLDIMSNAMFPLAIKRPLQLPFALAASHIGIQQAHFIHFGSVFIKPMHEVDFTEIWHVDDYLKRNTSELTS